MARRSADSSRVSALATFLNAELSRREWSNEKAAAEAVRKGHQLVGETVRKARNDLYREPLPSTTVEALAAAFGVLPEVIQRLDLQRWALGEGTTNDDLHYARPAGISDEDWSELKAKMDSDYQFFVRRTSREQ